MLGHAVGQELRGCKWIGVPFAGGMCELAHVKASTIVVNDLHRHVVNLARVVSVDHHRKTIQERLESMAFHPDILAEHQAACIRWEQTEKSLGDYHNLDAAISYFVSQWMGRSGKGGTDGEFSGKLPIRWNANGGDSNTRYRSAVESLDAWGEVMRGCNFSTLDVFEFLESFDDQPKHAIYCDPPFPDAGGEYKHKFTPAQHRQLAKRLAAVTRGRVVCRFYDHPLIREIYPEPRWTWRRMQGRKQTNEASPEVLIINGPSYATNA